MAKIMKSLKEDLHTIEAKVLPKEAEVNRFIVQQEAQELLKNQLQNIQKTEKHSGQVSIKSIKQKGVHNVHLPTIIKKNHGIRCLIRH